MKLTAEQIEKKDVAKEQLKEYRENHLYIKQKKEDLEEYSAIIEKATSILSHTRANGSGKDKLADQINKITELESEFINNLHKLLLKKFVIDGNIDKLEFPYRDVLFMRYSRAKSWDEIKRELKYDSEDYIYKLHGKALGLYANL